MRTPIIHAAAAAAALLAGAAFDLRASGAEPAPPAAEPAPVAGIGTPVPAASLQAMRGGDDTTTTTNTVDIRGAVDGNSADGIVSGANIIQDGSFANASGISTVIQNSGSNVLIQNGMVVNVSFLDPGQ